MGSVRLYCTTVSVSAMLFSSRFCCGLAFVRLCYWFPSHDRIGWNFLWLKVCDVVRVVMGCFCENIGGYVPFRSGIVRDIVVMENGVE